MRYIQLERRGHSIITIEEYLKEMQPYTLRRLKIEIAAYEFVERFRNRFKDVTEEVLAAAHVFGKDKLYAAIMQERPKPGRGGLLPGEGEEELW